MVKFDTSGRTAPCTSHRNWHQDRCSGSACAIHSRVQQRGPRCHPRHRSLQHRPCHSAVRTRVESRQNVGLWLRSASDCVRLLDMASTGQSSARACHVDVNFELTPIGPHQPCPSVNAGEDARLSRSLTTLCADFVQRRILSKYASR